MSENTEFTLFIPLKNKVHNITTTTDREIQLWQEFTMFRYEKNGLYGRKVTSPYIDQAKIYYLDSVKSNWKSSGLLYYYSFLNLAKAFIVTKRGLSANKLKSTSVFHGLSAKSQNVNSIIDYEVCIHPVVSNKKKNVFALFYEKLMNEKWPFQNSITIPIKTVLGYCDQITHELDILYGLKAKNSHLFSLIIRNQSEMWVELLVMKDYFPTISKLLQGSIWQIRNNSQMSQGDRENWFKAYGFTPQLLQNSLIVRINKITYSTNTLTQKWASLQKNVKDLFHGYIILKPIHNEDTDEPWEFIPPFSYNKKDIVWHPLLSNYLFAFVLSDVLRYHPHLLDGGDNKNSFLAEAWCNQSVVNSLRYFLMNFTNPQLRIN